jgi:tellurite resistance protein TerC
MHVSTTAWIVTLAAVVAILAIDLLIVGRRPHEPSMREAAIWVAVYVGLAVAFGASIIGVYGGRYSGEFFAGWVTEYSLSVDNLFVFVIIMARLAVPRHQQQRVLLIGIVAALVMRGAFIAAGAAVVSRFVWVFYFFGAFLIYTAVKLAGHGQAAPPQYQENPLMRWSRRALPQRIFTPMLVVMIAIGTTDLIFAFDSIPAIFGLTREPYLVFTANVFALMGLRQLYFLLGGLLDRLVYLSYGLAAVLAFIGVKLILEALHSNNVPFINSGDGLEWAPHIPIWLSLLVIVATLGAAGAASVLYAPAKSRGAG